MDIADGSYIHLVSRRGRIKVKTSVSGMTDRGVVFMPFHFYESAVNILTNPVLDPISKIPEFKVCAVRIEKAA
jgi:formate dehydrogenase alpha subunit